MIREKILFLLFAFFFCIFIYAQNNYNYQYEIVKMDTIFDQNIDLTMETYMFHFKQEKENAMSQYIGRSKATLTSFSPMSLLSNLLVDMLFEWGNNYLLSKKMNEADLALLNFGGIRAALPQGRITIGDIYQIFPFDNTIAFVFVKGSELKKMFDGFTEKRNAPMSNVKTIYSTGRLNSYTIGGAVINPDKIYTLVTTNFLVFGGDDILKNVNYKSIIYLDILLRDVFIEEIYKKNEQNIEIELFKDDRVIILPTP